MEGEDGLVEPWACCRASSWAVVGDELPAGDGELESEYP